jgi:organic hydroperoxide reductase OsmC/OhrA
MALSNILDEHGHAPESVRATARVHLRNVDGAPEAKAGCPVSRALAGVPEIELSARLA